MTTVAEGAFVPDFSALATSDTTFTLADYQGRANIVLYFYPKDSTPGCTTEGQNFRDSYAVFQENDTEIFGISKDTMRRHENFKAKQSFPFELISDIDESVCQLFDVIKEKKMYGKTFMGIERSTFLINKEGILVKEWRKVKVNGHVDEILQTIQQIE